MMTEEKKGTFTSKYETLRGQQKERERIMSFWGFQHLTEIEPGGGAAPFMAMAIFGQPNPEIVVCEDCGTVTMVPTAKADEEPDVSTLPVNLHVKYCPAIEAEARKQRAAQREQEAQERAAQAVQEKAQSMSESDG